MSDISSCALKGTTAQLLSLSFEFVQFCGYGTPRVSPYSLYDTQFKVLLLHFSKKCNNTSICDYQSQFDKYTLFLNLWIIFGIFSLKLWGFFFCFYIPTKVSPPTLLPSSSPPYLPCPAPSTSTPHLFLFRYKWASHAYQFAMMYQVAVRLGTTSSINAGRGIKKALHAIFPSVYR